MNTVSNGRVRASVLARLASRLCAEAGLPASALDNVVQHSGLRDTAAVQGRVQQLIDIRDLCQLARLPELFDSLTASGLDTEAARARLFDRLVQQAGQELDNVPPETTTPPANHGPSAHRHGLACDFVAPKFGKPLAICQAIEAARAAGKIAFDQLICEFPHHGGWVHIGFSLPPAHGRSQLLTAIKRDGHTVYLPGLQA